MRIPKKALLLAVQRGVKVEDVFSTDLYTGNGSTQTITNGIDIAGEGGLVWAKRRDSTANHELIDTERGAEQRIFSNLTAAQDGFGDVSSFNSSGFGLAAGGSINASGSTNVSWTFRQAPKFFDIVQYTGDGTSGRQISHNLEITPGVVIVKRTDADGSSWNVWHRSLAGEGSHLNSTIIFSNKDTDFGDPLYQGYISGADENTFSVTSSGGSGLFDVNISGKSYIAYIFSHDPSDSGIIQCGIYSGNSSMSGPTVNLGWQPQWIMIKSADIVGDWFILDNKRDTINPRRNYLEPNTADPQAVGRDIEFTSSGFQIKSTDETVNQISRDYVYMAIRAPE